MNTRDTPEPVATIGTAPDGSDIRRVQLEQGALSATIMTWGASLVDLRLSGIPHSLVLGSHDPEAYRDGLRYFGAIVGPVANRIAQGRFMLDGQSYETDRNENDTTTLHGGSSGFGECNWQLESFDGTSCTLSFTQPDGLCGFPGPLVVHAVYSLEQERSLSVTIDGLAERDLFFNPAFHAYWNLDGGETLEGHRLRIPAEHYLAVDEALIPVGAPVAVEDTAFDYRRARRADPSLDHNFCISDARGPLREVCRVLTDSLELIVESGEPGLQIYTAGALDTSPWPGHSGTAYGNYAGIAIEPQCWPDTPNRPDFPDCRLSAGTRYCQQNRFTLQKR